MAETAPTTLPPLEGMDQPTETPASETVQPPKAEASAPKGFKPYMHADGRWITHPQQGPWNTPEAVRVMVFEDDGQPRILKLELGTLPPVEIVRGYEVIIPKDAFSVLVDMMHPQIKCDMNVTPPLRYEAKVTTAKFTQLGFATWGEYIAFREAEKKKDKPVVNRRPIM